MAKSTGEGGGTEATTLIFPKKSEWAELREAKVTAKKRASSANGTFSKVLARLVEDGHMDRRAARLVLALDAIEDDEDLHVCVHHLVDGMKKLGILERAMAAPDLFDEQNSEAIEKSAAAGAKAARGNKKNGGKKGGEADMTNVTPIGEVARKVAEGAGQPQPGA